MLTNPWCRLPSGPHADILDVLIAHHNTPSSILRGLATLLIRSYITPSGVLEDKGADTELSRGDAKHVFRRLLSALQQRRPAVLHDAVKDVSEDGHAREAIEQLVLSLSLVSSSRLAVHIGCIQSFGDSLILWLITARRWTW
jgi:hypothetical protein